MAPESAPGLGILRFSAVNTFQSAGFKASIHLLLSGLPATQAVGDLHSVPRLFTKRAKLQSKRGKETKWTARLDGYSAKLSETFRMKGREVVRKLRENMLAN